MDELPVENPYVRRAKILKLRTLKLKDAYTNQNFDLTKKLLIDVELELSELESEGLEEIPVSELTFVNEIMSESKSTVENVNNAVTFATGLAGSEASSNASVKADQPFEYEDVKLRYKPFIFDGEIKHWREFWDRFNVQILSRRRLTKVTKFSFLIECLRGKALDLVKGYSMTESNFDAAIEKLRQRYDNPERLVTAYYDELKEIVASDDSSAAAQRNNFDNIQKILKNLESVGVNTDQDYLRTIIMCKFSKETLRGALKEVKRVDDMYSLTDFMSAIDSVLKIEEYIELALKNRPIHQNKTQKNVTGVFVGGTSSSRSGSGKKKNSSGSGGGPIRTERKQKECLFCDTETHNSSDCMKFGTLHKRRAVLSKKGLCFVCTKRHRVGDCPDIQVKCPGCQKTGHGLVTCITHMIAVSNRMRKERENLVGTTRGEKSSSSNSNQPSGSSESGTFLPTFICKIKNPRVAHQVIEVRGLLDSGSKKSYINEYLCRKLKVKSSSSNTLQCFRFGSYDAYEIESEDFSISLLNSDDKFRTCTFTSTPCVTGGFRTSPSPSFAQSVLPKDIKFGDPDIFVMDQRPLELLIGGDLYNQFVDLTKTKKLKNGLNILHTFFGQVPFGNINDTRGLTSVLIADSNPKPIPNIDTLFYIDTDFDFSNLTDLQRLWAIEIIGIKESEIENEYNIAVEQYRKTVKTENKRVVCCWPWKHMKPNLASNYRVARARLRALASSLNLENKKKYNDIFKDYLEKGVLEIAPKETDHLVHYLPHRAIKQKEKVRVVFDGSAITSSGHSINDQIYKGPPMQKDVIKLLLNFRVHPVAITADIEKAFLQLGLNEVDRDVCRLLWLKDITKPAEAGNIVHLRFARVPFGVNASPFLLNIVVNEHLASGNEWCTLAKERFYVDNLVVSVPDTNSAINLFQSLRNKFDEISMNLRDWASNDNTFIGSLPKELTEKSDTLISILGINWDRKSDLLYIKLNSECPSEPNKRNALKFLASIFDPLGFFGPSTLRLKVFLQSCWKKKFEWNERLPSLLEAELGKLRSELLLIDTIPLKRRMWTFELCEGTISLHVFCDASIMAFACAAYLVYYNERTCQSASTLIMCKVRTAPINPLSIPKLELLGVLIGKRLAVFLREALHLEINETILWTDATTVLQWLNSTSVLPLFIHNRISEIRRTPGISIRHTSGKQNPADLATRGENPKELSQNKLWWSGPTWLTCKALWPSVPLNTEIFASLSCEETAVLCSGTSVNNLLTEGIENRFSSWEKRIRIFSLVLKIRHVWLQRIRGDNSNTSDNVDIRIEAEQLLIKELQKKYNGREYKILLKVKTEYLDNNLAVPEALKIKSDLDLFMDEKLLLRCGGRLQNATFEWDTIHPILLPRKGKVARSYIEYLHKTSHHIGLSHLLSKIREKYWIPKCRTLIKSVLHRCVGCRRWTGGSFRLPVMPPLPLERVEEASPFLNIGIDYMGPLKIKSGNSVQKVYVVIFACLVTRAIHLEIARDNTAAEFLRTFMRFSSIRGCPKFVITDNASNFVFIQPMIADKVNIDDRAILDYSALHEIKWKFIPQYSPWQGGAYERLINIVKSCIRKSYYQHLLDYVDFLTALYNIADTINSRPLTYVSSDELVAALTPNHFLRLRTCGYANKPVQIRNYRTDFSGRKIREIWEHINGVVENFWVIFQKDYLTLLREKHIISHPSPRGSLAIVPKVGQVVLVKELGEPRSSWKLGRILQLDSRQAVATLQLGRSTIIRSINFLYPLEIASEETQN